jgi:glycosyltransferase involved in cell wall biosynthesis
MTIAEVAGIARQERPGSADASVLPGADGGTAAPLVSVCIPAYRGGAVLGRTMASVLSQTLADLELIVIDDNSPDDTVQVVESFADPRVRLLRNAANLGPEGNWSRCLSEARGRYFKLLPQDDVLDPECLARQVSVLEGDRDEQLALVFCARRVIDADDREVVSRGYPGSRGGRIAGKDVVRHCARLGTNLLGEPGAVLFRRSLANRIGRFDASCAYVVDLDYWYRLLAHGDAFYLPERLAAFRVSSGSWSVAIGARQYDDFRRFLEKYRALPQYGLGAFDVLLGRTMARLNNVLRLLVYRVLIRRR